MIKFSDKLVPKKQQKKWDRENKKRDSSKFWTKNRDCPSKSGTVGKYAVRYLLFIYLHALHRIIKSLYYPMEGMQVFKCQYLVSMLNSSMSLALVRGYYLISIFLKAQH